MKYNLVHYDSLVEFNWQKERKAQQRIGSALSLLPVHERSNMITVDQL